MDALLEGKVAVTPRCFGSSPAIEDGCDFALRRTGLVAVERHESFIELTMHQGAGPLRSNLAFKGGSSSDRAGRSNRGAVAAADRP
jgi:hypothetical protein